MLLSVSSLIDLLIKNNRLPITTIKNSIPCTMSTRKCIQTKTGLQCGRTTRNVGKKLRITTKARVLSLTSSTKVSTHWRVGPLPLTMGLVDSNANADHGANLIVNTVGHNPDAAYIWGLDWNNNTEHAMAIHEDMMKKGLAIGEYYRSKFDPTYGTTDADPGDAKSDVETGTSEREGKDVSIASAAVAPFSHNPDLDFPPWGVDPAADREHGMAIGQYWKQNGKAMGNAYKKRGMELGKYYEIKYRSLFDPTYDPATNDSLTP
jgi:hypothetical protein